MVEYGKQQVCVWSNYVFDLIFLSGLNQEFIDLVFGRVLCSAKYFLLMHFKFAIFFNMFLFIKRVYFT